MPSILFVCTANQFRSPIAAACFSTLIEREKGAERWRVESAGTWVSNGTSIPAITLRVAGSLGLPGLGRHIVRQIDRELLEGFDLILVMELGHQEALCSEFASTCPHIYLLSEVVDGIRYDIPDLGGAGVASTEIGAMLFDMLARGKQRIMELAKSLSKE